MTAAATSVVPRLLVSLPVHERRAVIVDQLQNFAHFLPTAKVVLHLSQAYAEETDFSEETNAIVNPHRLKTRWGHIAHVHIANIEHALATNVDFDFVLFAASNELLIRPGLAEHIGTADALIDLRGRLDAAGDLEHYTPFLAKACLTNNPRRRLSPFAEKFGVTVCGSQIEGSGYSRTAMTEMLDLIRSEIGYEQVTAWQFALEESLFPTSFLAAQTRRPFAEIKPPTAFVDFRQELSSTKMLQLIKYLRGEPNARMRRYLDHIDGSRPIFSVKRVPRRYYDPVRVYLREQIAAVEPSPEAAARYREEDREHRRREWKSQFNWKQFKYALAALGSRALFQYPAFIRFDLVDRYRRWKRRRRTAVAAAEKNRAAPPSSTK